MVTEAQSVKEATERVVFSQDTHFPTQRRMLLHDQCPKYLLLLTAWVQS